MDERQTHEGLAGMLIALERRKTRATQAFRAIVGRGLLPVVPAVVYAEWWRGPTEIREAILAAVIVEDMPAAHCRAAGEALGFVKGASLADAVVMASARVPRRRCGLHERSARSRPSGAALFDGSGPAGLAGLCRKAAPCHKPRPSRVLAV